MSNSSHVSLNANRVPAGSSAAPANFSRLWYGLARWYRRRLAIKRLHSLDDRMLRDIGISRSEIEYVTATGTYDRHRGRGGAWN